MKEMSKIGEKDEIRSSKREKYVGNLGKHEKRVIDLGGKTRKKLNFILKINYRVEYIPYGT